MPWRRRGATRRIPMRRRGMSWRRRWPWMGLLILLRRGRERNYQSCGKYYRKLVKIHLDFCSFVKCDIIDTASQFPLEYLSVSYKR